MGGIFKAFTKVAQVAIPAVLAYYTGGLSTAAGTGIAGMSAAGTAAAGSAITGVIGAVQKVPKASAATGVTAPASTAAAAPADTSAQQAALEQQKRLALNAQGGSGNTTTPLGVTGSATVTKKKLLGA